MKRHIIIIIRFIGKTDGKFECFLNATYWLYYLYCVDKWIYFLVKRLFLTENIVNGCRYCSYCFSSFCKTISFRHQGIEMWCRYYTRKVAIFTYTLTWNVKIICKLSSGQCLHFIIQKLVIISTFYANVDL